MTNLKKKEENTYQDMLSRNQEKIRFNAKYALVYETDMEGSLSTGMIFHGWEIEDGIKWLVHNDLNDKECFETELHLAELVDIWGRIRLGENLSQSYPQDKIDFVQCALSGCQECYHALKEDFAIYMALRSECAVHDEYVFKVDSESISEDEACECSMCSCETCSQISNLEKKLEAHTRAIVDAFKKDPRNKIYVDSHVLSLSARVESGKDFSKDKIESLIQKHLKNSLNLEELIDFDSALFVCYDLAKECFALKPDASISFSFLENEHGFVVEVRSF